MDLDAFVANPSVPRPTFVSSEMTQKTPGNLIDDGQIGKHLLRIQDAQLQEMRDDGWCKSTSANFETFDKKLVISKCVIIFTEMLTCFKNFAI